jgi:hypothetical protein
MRRAHWLQRSVQEQMVNHVTAAQKRQPVTMEQPMQPVTGQFRNEARTDYGF